MLAEPPVFVVADGMGGRAAGEEASRLAVAAFDRFAGGPEPAAEDVLAAIDQANTAIRAAGREPGFAGMGTTLVGLALVAGGRWLAFNVGDSRLYRLADEELAQVSVDHSEVQELVRAGLLSADERRGHPRGHLITRALGVTRTVLVDSWPLDRVPGERFLLCSDGLSDELPDDEIGGLLATGEPADAAARLVRAAIDAGGRDNVSVVVVDMPVPG